MELTLISSSIRLEAQMSGRNAAASVRVSATGGQSGKVGCVVGHRRWSVGGGHYVRDTHVWEVDSAATVSPTTTCLVSSQCYT